MLNNRYIWLVVGIIAALLMGAIVANWIARIIQLGVNTSGSDNQFGAVLGGQLIFNVALFIAAEAASVLTLFFSWSHVWHQIIMVAAGVRRSTGAHTAA